MLEVLQFIFDGTVLWGLPRFFGVVILLALVMGGLAAVIGRIRK